MTKKTILALALVAALAAVAVPSFASFHSHGMENKEGNVVCSLCNGTGLSNRGQGPFRCPWCNGSGFKGSY